MTIEESNYIKEPQNVTFLFAMRPNGQFNHFPSFTNNITSELATPEGETFARLLMSFVTVYLSYLGYVEQHYLKKVLLK